MTNADKEKNIHLLDVSFDIHFYRSQFFFEILNELMENNVLVGINWILLQGFLLIKVLS